MVNVLNMNFTGYLARSLETFDHAEGYYYTNSLHAMYVTKNVLILGQKFPFSFSIDS